LGFAVIANRGRAMMHRANVPLADRYKLFKEAFKTATLLDGLVVITIDGKEATRYEHWCGKNPDFTAHLRVWGEAGTVTIKSNMNTKVKDRGVHCMMVGYALNHAGDTYRMWDKNTIECMKHEISFGCAKCILRSQSSIRIWQLHP
jgi:hypothetical protein